MDDSMMISMMETADTEKKDFISMESSTFRMMDFSIGDGMRHNGEEVKGVHFSDLEFGINLGAGACSAVQLARHKTKGLYYAIKWFRPMDNEQMDQLGSELHFFFSADCPGLIKFHGAFKDDDKIGVVLEFMDKGTLKWLTTCKREMDEVIGAAIIYQMLIAIGYLHHAHKIHRDIKPANILLNSSGEVKLADFGIVKTLDATDAMTTTSVGTVLYMAPERLMPGEVSYSNKVDIWALGLTILEIWARKFPLSCIDSPMEVLEEIHATEDKLVDKKVIKSSDLRKLLRHMLKVDPEKRHSAAELLKSPWFEDCGINNYDDARLVAKAWIESDSFKSSNISRQSGGKEFDLNISL